MIEDRDSTELRIKRHCQTLLSSCGGEDNARRVEDGIVKRAGGARPRSLEIPALLV